jgi:hypothetical protein
VDNPTEIEAVGSRIHFLPPSDNTPDLKLLDDYFLTPDQMETLNYTARSSWTFNLRELVRVAKEAILCMHDEQRNIPPTQYKQRKRKILHDEPEDGGPVASSSRAKHS